MAIDAKVNFMNQRDYNCRYCPLQGEICDELAVEMESLPAELVDMIEEELEEK